MSRDSSVAHPSSAAGRADPGSRSGGSWITEQFFESAAEGGVAVGHLYPARVQELLPADHAVEGQQPCDWDHPRADIRWAAPFERPMLPTPSRNRAITRGPPSMASS